MGDRILCFPWIKGVCSGSEAKGKKTLVLATIDDRVEEAIETTKAEQVIAVPTTTLYGFALHFVSSAEAVKEVYEIKGCKQTSPFAITVSDVNQLPFIVIRKLVRLNQYQQKTQIGIEQPLCKARNNNSNPREIYGVNATVPSKGFILFLTRFLRSSSISYRDAVQLTLESRWCFPESSDSISSGGNLCRRSFLLYSCCSQKAKLVSKEPTAGVVQQHFHCTRLFDLYLFGLAPIRILLCLRNKVWPADANINAEWMPLCRNI
ncbi:hypothetical protein OPV22_017295 [Ensete ventricosum]|uniref:Threonylcarbamoyl-AMP synthase n=1 Tax=Ensete ventricosum TaxID=4639 RepID=A0AAV8PF36_ENSVE|nr:hypothetical protein OPV22_017295 [Ensete ventricosum]